MAKPISQLVFPVQRHEPELVRPAKPTPHEFKPLSDIDDQAGLRFQISNIQFYPNNAGMEGRDPVKVIREAISKALVFYYPLAGRLREKAGHKLVVECTGEGILFIEADASVRLEQFGEVPQPPFPCIEELHYDVPGSSDILNCPLLLIQVTRLLCGGFTFVCRTNHTMCDAIGLLQLLNAVSEIARGATSPSVLPVWKRELLNARDPPDMSCMNHEYEKPSEPIDPLLVPGTPIVKKTFVFGKNEITAIRNHVPPYLHKCTVFDIITACVWRCRTIALDISPENKVYLAVLINFRDIFNPPLPTGFYGNGIIYPIIVSSAGKLCENPVSYALELVKKGKEKMTEEYVKSIADWMVLKGRPIFNVVRTFFVSDLRWIGFKDVDFGWGKAIYGGSTNGGIGEAPIATFYTTFRNNKGEDGILVPIGLPKDAMERFVNELESITKKPVMEHYDVMMTSRL